MGIHFTDVLFNVRRYCYIFFAFTDQPSAYARQASTRVNTIVLTLPRVSVCVFSPNGLRQQSQRWAYFRQQCKFPPTDYVLDGTRAVITSAGPPYVVRTWVGFSTTG